MEFPRLANCLLLRPKRLKLTLTAGAPAHIDRIHVQFLYKTSYGSREATISLYPPGFLPNFKRLNTRTIPLLYACPRTNATRRSSQSPYPPNPRSPPRRSTGTNPRLISQRAFTVSHIHHLFEV